MMNAMKRRMMRPQRRRERTSSGIEVEVQNAGSLEVRLKDEIDISAGGWNCVHVMRYLGDFWLG